MAKVFISFLGTNDYVPCTYVWGNNDVADVRFVQEAMIRLHCLDWSADDRILIFTTRDALNKNWQNNGHINPKSGDPLNREGLDCCVQRLNISARIERIDIPDGKSEDEIWEVFGKVFGALNENEDIMFDITHALRSIPMLTMVVLQYAKVMKNVNLSGIYYGAFEVLGSPYKVSDMPLAERRAPIFDLTSFAHLTDWSVAIDRFIKSGDAGLVSQLATHSARSILSKTGGADRSQHNIRRLAENLDLFTRIMATCRGRDISRQISRLKDNIETCSRMELINPFKPVFERLKQEMDGFKGSVIEEGIQAARWCRDHHMIQQAYTILEEMLISYFIMKAGVDPLTCPDKIRTAASQSAAIFKENIPREKWNEPARSYPDIVATCLDLFGKNENVVKLFNNIRSLRNDINHCGFSADSAKPETLEKSLSGFLDDLATMDFS